MAPLADDKKVVVGEHLAIVNYYTVTGTDSEWIHCKDTRGNAIRVGRAVVPTMMSTSQYTREVKTTRTEIAQKIESAGHAPMRIKFYKQIKNNDVADGLDGKDLSTTAKRRKVLNQLMKGELRDIHCKLKRSKEDDVQMELGRFRVDDLELYGKGGCTERLVDTRTVEELILEGVRYYV